MKLFPRVARPPADAVNCRPVEGLLNLSIDAGASRPHQTGFVLVAILVVILLASMVAMSLLFRVNAEQTATSASNGGDQAWAAAMSGVQEAIRAAQAAVSGSVEIEDNPALFRERLMFHDGADAWYFSVFAPPTDELRAEARFGLAEEAGKLNLNLADESMLGKLPRMSPSLVQAALDFMDADNIPRPEGAEQEYYDALPQPYLIRNGPLETLDELLLVRGFTPSLLYGEDANLNFRLDPNEDDGEEQFPIDNKDGRLNAGLAEFLTVSTYEPNLDKLGAPRLNVNEAVAVFPDGLPPGLTNYLTALRENQVKLRHPSELLEARGKFKLGGAGVEVELSSGVGKEELSMVLDRFKVDEAPRVSGLINANIASIAVLQTVDGIDEILAESIVSGRNNLSPELRQSIAWLYHQGVVDAAKFKEIAPRLTAGCFQFSFHVVGYGVPSGRYRVLDVGIDIGGGNPAITRMRDITRLGLPFPIDINKPSPSKTSSDTRPSVGPIQQRFSAGMKRSQGAGKFPFPSPTLDHTPGTIVQRAVPIVLSGDGSRSWLTEHPGRTRSLMKRSEVRHG